MAQSNRIRRGAALLAYRWQQLVMPPLSGLKAIRSGLNSARTKAQRAELARELEAHEIVLEEFIGILSQKYPDNLSPREMTATQRDVIRMALDRAERFIREEAKYLKTQYREEKADHAIAVADSMAVARSILER